MRPRVQSDASRIFSTALFRRLLNGKFSDPEPLNAIARRLKSELDVAKDSNNLAVIKAAYDFLRTSYRCEYYYKNLIAGKIFVGRHRAANSVLLNEFRVGQSVADCVIVNGTATVYEIKTEFDSPDKMHSQISNYFRAFPLVNIVVHENHFERYERMLSSSPAGIVAVKTNGRLSAAKPAAHNSIGLKVQTMFDTLRRHEVEDILINTLGHTPDVPNGLRYNAELELAQSIDPDLFQLEMQRVLKGRALKWSRDLILDANLDSLRTIITQLDPGEGARRNLIRWLTSEVG